MNPTLAAALLLLTGSYLTIGLAFALVFVTAGAGRIDPSAATGTLGFRLLILPGSAALWPLLLRRWLAARPGPPAQHDAHTDAARASAARRGGATR